MENFVSSKYEELFKKATKDSFAEINHIKNVENFLSTLTEEGGCVPDPEVISCELNGVIDIKWYLSLAEIFMRFEPRAENIFCSVLFTRPYNFSSKKYGRIILDVKKRPCFTIKYHEVGIMKKIIGDFYSYDI